MRRFYYLLLAMILIPTVSAYTAVFNDSTTSESFIFSNTIGGTYTTISIDIPKNASFSTANVDIIGAEYWAWNATATNVSRDTDHQFRPRIAVDSNDVVHIVWIDNRTNPNYNVYYWNSSSATATAVAAGANEYLNPEIAIGPLNIPHVVWYSNASGGIGYDIYYANQSSGWANVKISNNAAGNSKNPVVAVDSIGTIHIAWQDDRNTAPKYQIWYANSSSGFSEVNITNGVRDDVTPAMDVDSNDVVHIVYQDPILGEEPTETKGTLQLATCVSQGKSVTYIKYMNSSSNWAISTIISGVNTPICELRDPKIDIDGNDILHVIAWSDHLKYIHYWNSTHGTYTLHDGVGYVTGKRPDIAVDANNIKHVYYAKATLDPDAYYTNSTNWGWQSVKIGETVPVYSSPSISVGNHIGVQGVHSAWAGNVSGDYEVYTNQFGFLPTDPHVNLSASNAFKYIGKYKAATNVTNISAIISSELSSCAPVLGNCTIDVMVNSSSRGIMRLYSLNISYGTQLKHDLGLAFHTSIGTDVKINPQYSDVAVFVYNGTNLTMSVPTTFSNQPDYTGFTAKAGKVGANNRGFVVTDELLPDARNTSLKSVYIKVENASLGFICFWNKTVPYINVTSVVNASDATPGLSDCADFGGVNATYPTVDIGGTTYFKIDNVIGSGGVQVPGGNLNTPPVLTNPRINRRTATEAETIVYTVTATDLDGDDLTVAGRVQVQIDGGGWQNMDSLGGGQFEFRTTLAQGNHNYKFQAQDGNGGIAQIALSQGPIISKHTIGVSSAPGFGFVGVLALFGLATVVFFIRRE